MQAKPCAHKLYNYINKTIKYSIKPKILRTIILGHYITLYRTKKTHVQEDYNGNGDTMAIDVGIIWRHY